MIPNKGEKKMENLREKLEKTARDKCEHNKELLRGYIAQECEKAAERGYLKASVTNLKFGGLSESQWREIKKELEDEGFLVERETTNGEWWAIRFDKDYRIKEEKAESEFY
jgi:hypothetical protein